MKKVLKLIKVVRGSGMRLLFVDMAIFSLLLILNIYLCIPK